MARGRKHATKARPPGEGAKAISSQSPTNAQLARSDAPGDNCQADGQLGGAEARQTVNAALVMVPAIVTRIELWKTERLVPLERIPRSLLPDPRPALKSRSGPAPGGLEGLEHNGATRDLTRPESPAHG